jgi:hypothetical protein
MVSRFGILFYVRLKVCCTNSLLNTVVTHDLSKRFFDSVVLLYFARSETVLCSTHFYILNLMTGRPTSVLVDLCCARMNFKLFLHCVVRFFLLLSTVFHARKLYNYFRKAKEGSKRAVCFDELVCYKVSTKFSIASILYLQRTCHIGVSGVGEMV